MLTRFENVAIALHDYVPDTGAALGASDIVNSVDTDAIADQVIEQVNP